MTNQEIFDKVWNGLKSQGFARCISESGMCVYRGPNGLKCAAGHVFTDEDLAKYNSISRRDKTDRHAPDFYATAARIASVLKLDVDTGLLNDLQEQHDVSGTPEEMRVRLIELATRYNLTVPE